MMPFSYLSLLSNLGYLILTSCTQYRVVEARVNDLQTHGVFPIHPAAHGLGSLAVRQALGTWQHCREGESLGRSSGLAGLGNKRANS